MRVRTALKLGLDRDIIANKVKGQGDLPAYGYTPPYTDGAKLSEPEWFTWSQEKRNEEAKKLLAEAGYSVDTRHQGTYDVARAGWCADYNEPTSFLNTMLSDSSMNTAHYKSPAFDKIMAESVKASDEAQRTAAYAKAEQQLDKDSAIVPVYYYVNARLVKPWVGGYTGKDPMDNVYTKDLYVIKH